MYAWPRNFLWAQYKYTSLNSAKKKPSLVSFSNVYRHAWYSCCNLGNLYLRWAINLGKKKPWKVPTPKKPISATQWSPFRVFIYKNFDCFYCYCARLIFICPKRNRICIINDFIGLGDFYDPTSVSLKWINFMWLCAILYRELKLDGVSEDSKLSSRCFWRAMRFCSI